MFELAEAFDTGISHPRWAGRPCVSVCLHMEGDEKCFKRKIPVRDWSCCPPMSHKSAVFLYPREICHEEALVSIFRCLEGQLWLSGVRGYAAAFYALLILVYISFISVLSEKLI